MAEQRHLLPKNSQLMSFINCTIHTLFANKMDQKRFFEFRATAGDQDAKIRLNRAAFNQQLDFTMESGRKYLDIRVAQGDQDAKNRLNYAAFSQQLGFTTEKEAQDLPNDEALHQIDEYDGHYYHLFMSTPEDIRQYIDSNKENQYMKELVDSAVMYQKLGFTQEDGIKCAYFKQGADQGNRLVQMYFDYTFIKQFILLDKHESLWNIIMSSNGYRVYEMFYDSFILESNFISKESKILYIMGRIWLSDYKILTTPQSLFYENRTAFYYYAFLGYIPLTHQ